MVVQMKKWEKGIYIFTGILFFLICISATIIYMYKDKIEKKYIRKCSCNNGTRVLNCNGRSNYSIFHQSDYGYKKWNA